MWAWKEPDTLRVQRLESAGKNGRKTDWELSQICHSPALDLLPSSFLFLVLPHENVDRLHSFISTVCEGKRKRKRDRETNQTTSM